MNLFKNNTTGSILIVTEESVINFLISGNESVLTIQNREIVEVEKGISNFHPIGTEEFNESINKLKELLNSKVFIS